MGRGKSWRLEIMRFENGNVAVFDGDGKQMPGLQGRARDAVERICKHLRRKERGSKLSLRVEDLSTIVHCFAVIDVGERCPIRVVQTFYCNCTGADRLMYGKGEDAPVLSHKLIAHLTREMVEGMEWLPLEDEVHNPLEGVRLRSRFQP